MQYVDLRNELHNFYENSVQQISENFNRKCSEILETRYDERENIYKLKSMQFNVIADNCTPIIFDASPFYYELGSMIGACDGCAEWHGHFHPGGWLYRKREHLFEDADPEMYKKTVNQKDELLYLVCGPYTDTRQHFCFNYRPVFEYGLKGIYEKTKKRMCFAKSQNEREFLNGICEGMCALKKISDKFSKAAEKKLETCTDKKECENLLRIKNTAARVPWNAPQTLYEALNTYLFIRICVGTLEGVGTNSFGRVDLDLYPIFLKDKSENGLTDDEALKLISQFLISSDCRYNHDMKMVGYSEHELENTYTLGGCDKNGEAVYNKITEMFLRANCNEKIIYPKIKCRYSSYSPREYIDAVNSEIIKGTSTVLYQNDEATVSALLHSGRSLEDARDYIVSGCWDLSSCGNEKREGGSYLNILKAFELSIHRPDGIMKKIGMEFKPIDNAQSFEQVYNITLENIRRLLVERSKLAKYGRLWENVDPHPIISCVMNNCIESAKDYTAGGAKYNDEVLYCVGFPNIIDSLIAIKTLCFDEKKYTLAELLNAVRNNWKGYESLRLDAVCCEGFGDGTENSCSLANRLNKDLYLSVQDLPTKWGGKYLIGHLVYTEIKTWGEKTLATPDGRFSGDYISQGFTPSRLNRIHSATAPLNSIASLDMELCEGNTVINVILSPNGITLDRAYGYVMAAAKSKVQCLQLNCFSKEQLLDAQKHPENYPDLIIRVCGFSAKFTSLSPAWQDEIITRNFYD